MTAPPPDDPPDATSDDLAAGDIAAGDLAAGDLAGGDLAGTAAGAACDEFVVLVDDDDRELGLAPKLAAHRDGGRQHRAFSVFLFDAAGRVLLQQRAASKYHFAGRWSNTCCSHPRPGEAVLDAARRRLQEEMGVVADDLCAVGMLRYEAYDDSSDLTERELDHIVIGRFEGSPRPHPDEADGWRWADPTTIDCSSGVVTPWFEPALQIALAGRSPAAGVAVPPS